MAELAEQTLNLEKGQKVKGQFRVQMLYLCLCLLLLLAYKDMKMKLVPKC